MNRAPAKRPPPGEYGIFDTQDEVFTVDFFGDVQEFRNRHSAETYRTLKRYDSPRYEVRKIKEEENG